MPDKWTGEIVGKMHNHKISKTRLACHMGVTREYVSMVLNGHRAPTGAREKFLSAINEIIETDSQREEE